MKVTKCDVLLLVWLIVKWLVDVWTLMLGIGFVLYAWIIIKLVIDAVSIVYIWWRLTQGNKKKSCN